MRECSSGGKMGGKRYTFFRKSAYARPSLFPFPYIYIYILWRINFIRDCKCADIKETRFRILFASDAFDRSFSLSSTIALDTVLYYYQCVLPKKEILG